MAMNYEDALNEKILKQAFNCVDSYGKGYIGKGELNDFFQNIDVKSGEISSFMDKYDKNHDGKVFFVFDKKIDLI